jgi:hypothetical protein
MSDDTKQIEKLTEEQAGALRMRNESRHSLGLCDLDLQAWVGEEREADIAVYREHLKMAAESRAAQAPASGMGVEAMSDDELMRRLRTEYVDNGFVGVLRLARELLRPAVDVEALAQSIKGHAETHGAIFSRDTLASVIREHLGAQPAQGADEVAKLDQTEAKIVVRLLAGWGSLLSPEREAELRMATASISTHRLIEKLAAERELRQSKDDVAKLRADLVVAELSAKNWQTAYDKVCRESDEERRQLIQANAKAANCEERAEKAEAEAKLQREERGNLQMLHVRDVRDSTNAYVRNLEEQSFLKDKVREATATERFRWQLKLLVAEDETRKLVNRELDERREIINGLIAKVHAGVTRAVNAEANRCQTILSENEAQWQDKLGLAMAERNVARRSGSEARADLGSVCGALGIPYASTVATMCEAVAMLQEAATKGHACEPLSEAEIDEVVKWWLNGGVCRSARETVERAAKVQRRKCGAK